MAGKPFLRQIVGPDPEGARLIPLTRGKVTIVDVADYEWASQFSWLCTDRGYAARSARVTPLGVTPRKCRTTYLHRELLAAPDGVFVDHANGNPLDNRRANIRLCTHSENMRNCKSDFGVSPYKGVFPVRSKWRAFITKDRKMRHLGYFATPEEAAAAYDAAAVILFGEFARLNLPREVTHA